MCAMMKTRELCEKTVVFVLLPLSHVNTYQPMSRCYTRREEKGKREKWCKQLWEGMELYSAGLGYPTFYYYFAKKFAILMSGLPCPRRLECATRSC